MIDAPKDAIAWTTRIATGAVSFGHVIQLRVGLDVKVDDSGTVKEEEQKRRGELL